jgi:hypothetical protein
MTISIYNKDFPYVISKFQKHEELKETLLESLNISQSISYTDAYDNISKTDWYIDANIARPYLDILFEPLDQHMITVLEQLKHDDFKYQTFWFQQYIRDNTHRWHQHRGTSWASVYYLELEKNGPPTVFKTLTGEEVIMPDVSEGDILTFPGFVWHCSPINRIDNRKTVIAFNIE